MMIRFAVILLSLVLATLACGSTVAQNNSGTALIWTKEQDLDPNAAPTNSPIKQKWALVIGVGRYQEARLNSSYRPDLGAQEFRDYLLDPRGGRFSQNHVKTLVNSHATRQNIMSALGTGWASGVAGPDDLLVIYIGTNSFPTTDGGAYLTTYNSELDNVFSTCISMRSLMETLKKNSPCKRVVLIVQAPYSGAAELPEGAKSLGKAYNIDTGNLELGKGYVLISSSSPEQMSWDNIFTTNLISALKRKNGFIGLPEAFDIARNATEQQTSAARDKRKQTPVMKYDWKGQDIVIGAVPADKDQSLPGPVETRLGAEAHYLRANQLAEQGKLDEALKEYRLATRTDPHYADALADEGAVLTLKSDWEQAADRYRHAIAERPDDSLFHANYARVLAKLGKYAESKSELETAYKLDPKDRVVLSALSAAYLRDGKPDRASELLREAASLYPKDAALRNQWSAALAQNGDLEEALVQANEAVRLGPDASAARLNLGSILLLNGKVAEAIAAYKLVIEASPQNADAYFLLGRALDSSGDRRGALSAMQRFLQFCAAGDPRENQVRERVGELGD